MLEFEQEPFEQVEFAENSEPRCPVVLVLDTSGSMGGRPIAELNEGLRVFRENLAGDSLAAKRVDLAVVTFGPVQVVNDFGAIGTFQPPLLTAGGNTPLGAAIERALDLLQARKAEYRQQGIASFRPWVFTITDGSPTDDCSRASRLISDGEEMKKFLFYAVGVENADMATLATISVRTPLHLKGLQFSDLFRWLSSSLRSVSRSGPGDQVALSNPAAPDGWATI